MATKRLSKSVIEGGRADRNKYDRKLSSKEERAAERAFLAEIKKDPNNFDEDIIEDRRPVGKEFQDKLNPMYRWLDAQVGKVWSEVRSEIATKFDIRTTAGRHITYDHLLSSVIDTRSGRDNRGFIAEDIQSYSQKHLEFFVDECGILRKNSVRDANKYYRLPKEEFEYIGKWLNGRMVGEKGGVLYWFSNEDGIWKSDWFKKDNPYPSIKLKYHNLINSEYEYKNICFGVQCIQNRVGLHWEAIENPSGFKQRGQLNKDEAKYFRSLNIHCQREILDFAKDRF